MDNYTNDELKEALQMVSATINGCEKIQPKFKVGTSQHTLLRNRLKALYISKSLITNENTNQYTKEELIVALPPVSSIIAKSEKAQQKFSDGTPPYNRFQKILKAMNIAKSLITNEIERKG